MLYIRDKNQGPVNNSLYPFAQIAILYLSKLKHHFGREGGIGGEVHYSRSHRAGPFQTRMETMSL